MDTTRIEDVRVEVVRPLTDSTKREMGMGNRERTGIVKNVRMPVMASFTPTLTRTLPFAYAFSAAAADSLLPILSIHGIRVERLSAPADVMAQGLVVDSVTERGRRETPRDLRDIDGRWSVPASRTLPAGSYIVPAGQPFGLEAFYLLEPESDDGLSSYLGAFIEKGKEYPVVRITVPATLSMAPVR
jgi:hypothetical protein